MKKLFSFFCSLAMLFTTISPTNAKSPIDVNVRYLSPTLEEYVISSGDEKHIVTIDRETYVLNIDGEEIVPEITEIPLTRATVDYSTAKNLTYDVPWRGTAAVFATLVALMPGVGTTVISLIVNFAAAEGDKLYITMTQYQSKESYYSSYTGTYYKKAINKNIKAYTSSISPSNLRYGPFDGPWFDPVRPN